MLNFIEMSDMWQFQMEMPDCKEKELLHTVLWEYEKYTRVGTTQEVEDMKEWMGLSINDIRRNFNRTVKGLREEVEYIREDKKRGRPKKKAKRGVEHDA